MKSFRRLISLFLLAAISLYIAPKDLLHELCQHEDTHDVICTDYCVQHFSNVHRHCEVLQLTTPPFHQTVNNFSFSSVELLCILSAESKSSYHFSLSPFLFLRGPPSLI